MEYTKPGEWKVKNSVRGASLTIRLLTLSMERECAIPYVAGCMFHCEGCYNVATWSFNAGLPYTPELEEQIIADLTQPYVQGLTLLGGEPFLNTGILLPSRETYTERIARKRYLVLDGIHMGRDDAGDT